MTFSFPAPAVISFLILFSTRSAVVTSPYERLRQGQVESADLELVDLPRYIRYIKQAFDTWDPMYQNKVQNYHGYE